MTRYFIQLAFNGKDFHGWQIQDNAITVQGELNKALSLLQRIEIKVTGCGRTDTGVNASQFFAHFDAENLIENLVYKLNGVLPDTIVIEKIISLHPEAHSRFDATARTYEYFFHTKLNPFLGDFSYYISAKLDVELMNEAASKLLEITDFTSFSKLHSDAYTNNCDVTFALVSDLKNGQYKFTITADRFLRNMVRAIVGTLIDVGRGRVTLQEFQEVIESKNRQNAGKSVDGTALFLAKIEYPYI
ncbi:tRNA pseudouridine(38-40) synthase TruA [Flavobacteriales bacterium]|nr:tRNA pseudouridine(38-40) synthase TruA [Flavobacteriales bacterium]MDB4089312.1 tRNA pseudouridine(38-40) synthase TruA [Flavobacteriales bacterium]